MIGCSGALLAGTGFFLLWHGKQFWQHSSMSRNICGQKNLSLTLEEVLAVPKWPRSSCIIWRTLEVRLRWTITCPEPGFSTLLCLRIPSSPTLRLGHSLNKTLRSVLSTLSGGEALDISKDLIWESVGQLSCCCLPKSRGHASCATAFTPWTLLKASATVFLFPAMWWTLHWNSLNLSTHLHNQLLCSLVQVRSHLRDSWSVTKSNSLCCGHKMFLNKIRNTFCALHTKFVSATNVARAGKQGNICVGNNAAGAMCQQQNVSSFARAFRSSYVTSILNTNLTFAMFLLKLSTLSTAIFLFISSVLLLSEVNRSFSLLFFVSIRYQTLISDIDKFILSLCIVW